MMEIIYNILGLAIWCCGCYAFFWVLRAALRWHVKQYEDQELYEIRRDPANPDRFTVHPRSPWD